jgi:nitroreductase
LLPSTEKPESMPMNQPTPLLADAALSDPTLSLLARRRSVGPGFLTAPGPSADNLQQILTIAARVPDHKKLVPWRFVLFEGAARNDFGAVLADVLAREQPAQATPDRLALERGRFARAPLVVTVVSRVVENPAAPEWEQILSAGACCQNLVIAANAMGFGTAWITEWCAYSPGVAAALGLARHERVAGFVYVGTPRERPAERERPVVAAITQHWTPK